MYAKCSVDTESLILITVDSQHPREGKGYSHFDWRYVRWLQSESWSPDFWSVLRRTVVTVIPLPAQLFLIHHNTVTSCSRAEAGGAASWVLGVGLTRASPADTPEWGCLLQVPEAHPGPVRGERLHAAVPTPRPHQRQQALLQLAPGCLPGV